jgi:hypothetical protein
MGIFCMLPACRCIVFPVCRDVYFDKGPVVWTIILVYLNNDNKL